MSSQNPSLQDLYDLHKKPLHFFFKKRGCSDQDAEDLTQHTFVKAIRHLSKFRRECSEKTWLYQIARSVLFNHYRTQNRNPLTTNSTRTEHEIHELEGNLDDPLDWMIGQEQMDELKREIDKLPSQMRSCVFFFYFQNMKIQEIAQVLRVNGNTVKSHLFQAREKLKTALHKPISKPTGPERTR